MFFERLKEIGVYDNTMIFVLADHGAFYLKVNIENSRNTEKHGSALSRMDRVKSHALPLFLVKPFHSEGRLKVSDAPVAHSDVAKTIISELRLEGESFPGVSIFDIADSDVRYRRFLYYGEVRGYSASYMQHLPSMKEFMVSGFSWRDASWRETNRLFTSEGVKDNTKPTYEYGTTIQFGKAGNCGRYQGFGWDYPEDGFTWTNQKSATLAIPIRKTDSLVELRATIKPFIVPGKADKQRVRVFINDWYLDEWLVTNDEIQERSAVVPNASIPEDKAEIILELPDAISPAQIGVSDDVRILGIRVYSLTLWETTKMPVSATYRWGAPIQFGIGGNHIPYLREGWARPEREVTWTSGSSASLVIPIEETQSDVRLTATFTPFLVQDRLESQRVNVLVNGQHVGSWIAREQTSLWRKIRRAGNSQEHTLIIPSSLLTPTTQITFELPDAASPADLHVNVDQRVLALAVRSIVLTELTADSEM